MTHSSRVSSQVKARQKIDEYLLSLEGDGPLSEDDLVKANPEIAAELEAEFTKLGRVRAAQRAADSGDDCSRPDPVEPEIRCPFCNAPSEASMNESFRLMKCGACGSTFSLIKETADRLSEGAQIGHFELVERLGEGGFGSVWKAHDTDLERFVALKMPRRLSMGDREQILREARAAATLNHPNIVKVHEVGLDDDTIYIACDLIDGLALSGQLESGRYTFAESAALCKDIAQALDHAHTQGVVHRDLKPQNVLISLDGDPHLTDFGLARHESPDVTMTIDGQVIGTPAYMSPEQAMGQSHSADGRADIFSLGVMLYEMLTGVVPFRGTPPMVMSQVVSDDPVRPRKLNNRIPLDLETICLKCMEKQPDARYENAADVAAEFIRFLNHEPIVARPAGPVRKSVRWCQRNPAVALLAAGISATTLTCAVLVVLSLMQREVADTNAYFASLSLSREVRSSSKEGYRGDVFAIAKEWSHFAKTHGRQHELQQEVVASLGDYDWSRGAAIHIPDKSATTATVTDTGLAAVGLDDGEVRIYRLDGSGDKPIATVRELKNRVRGLHFLNTTEGAWSMLSVDESGRVVTSRKSNDSWMHQELVNSGTEVTSARFSNDGHLLAIHDDTHVAIYDTSNWERVFECETLNGMPLRSVAISPDKLHVAAGYDDAKSNSGFHIWLMDGSGETQSKPINRGSTYRGGIAFSPDGRYLAFACELTIVYEMATMERITQIPIDESPGIAIGPNSKYVASIDIRGEINVHTLGTNARLARLQHSASTDRGMLIGFSKGGMYSLDKHTLRQWDLRLTDERLELAGHEGAVPTVTFTPDDRFLLSGGKNSLIKVWDAVDGRPVDEFNCDGSIQTIVACNDSQHFAVMFGDRTEVEFRRLSDGKIVDTFDTEMEFTRHMALSPSGRRIAVAGAGVRVWNLAWDAGLITVEPIRAPNGMTDEVLGNWNVHACFDDRGEQLFWGRIHPQRQLFAWDLSNNTYRAIKDANFGAGWHGVAHLADRDELIFVGDTGLLQLWELKTNELKESSRTDFQFRSPHLAVHPSHPFVAALIDPRQIALWDMQKKHPFSFRPEETAVWSIAWSPSGNRLALGLSGGGLVMRRTDLIESSLRELGIPLFEASE